MQETDKLKLRKPEYNEYADVADLNHNMNILDEKVDGKLGKTEKAADSEKLDGLDSLLFARSYSFANNDFIPKEIFNNPAHLQSYIGGINYGKEAGLPDDFSKIIFLPSNLDGYGTQIAIPYGSGDTFGVYYRNATTKTWNSWLELLDTRERAGFNSTTDAPGDDANNCLETGKAYACVLDRTKNLPSFKGSTDEGIIIPYMMIKGQFGSQIFMPLDSTSIWLRIVKNGVWSKWCCIGGGSWNQELQKDSEQVVKYQRWANYGQNHVIFDASKGIRPDGQACDRTNAQNQWTATYPTLMGFNGQYTYGLRTDSARNADCVAGFQFRNNNGILEVLINGVWMAVGGQIYNNIKQFNFSTYTTTTNNGTTYYHPAVREGEVKTLVDIQRPCKLVAMNSTSSIAYTAGNQMDPACRGIRELRVYIDDILKFTALVFQENGNSNGQGRYLINGDPYFGEATGAAYYNSSYIKKLEARKRFKIDALIGTGITNDGRTYNDGKTPTLSTFFAQFLIND